AFVEEGQEVAQPAAAPLLARNRGGVHGVDARLGARKREPAERVEPVMQIAVARFDAAGLMYPQLVWAALSCRGHEAHRHAAFGGDAGSRRGRVEHVERAPEAEPRRKRLVYRMP